MINDSLENVLLNRGMRQPSQQGSQNLNAEPAGQLGSAAPGALEANQNTGTLDWSRMAGGLGAVPSGMGQGPQIDGGSPTLSTPGQWLGGIGAGGEVVPSQSPGIPPQAQRFETGQAMQDAYRNGWQPNPLLIRLMQGNRPGQALPATVNASQPGTGPIDPNAPQGLM